MSQAETRLAGAEQLICAYALVTTIGRDPVIEVLEEDTLLTDQAQWFLASLKVHEEGQRITGPSLTASGLDAKQLEWVRQFEGEAYQHPFERAVESLRACRVYAVAAKVLDSALNDTITGPMTDRAVATLLTDVADTLQGLGVDALDRASDENTAQEWLDKWREQFEQDIAHGSATWGSKTLDAKAGNLAPGTLTGLAGLPGHGKSVLAMNACRASAQFGKRALYVCLEMGEPELAKRLACNAADSYAHEVESIVRDRDEEAWQQIRDRVPDVTLKVCGLREARTLVRQAYAKGERFDVVVFDYLQMFKFGSERDNEAKRLQDAAYFMKNEIAMRYRCGVLVLCQFSKEEGKRAQSGDIMPTFRNVRGASAIEDAVDVAVCIRRDAEPTGELTYGAKSYALDFSVPKFRNGEVHDHEPYPNVRLFGGKFRIEDPVDSTSESIDL